MVQVYEQIFFLKQYGNWNFSEAYNLPIGLREWFTGRLKQHLEKMAEKPNTSSPPPVR